MRTPRQHELVLLLSSRDPRLLKRGLQRICDAIEAGVRIDLTRDPTLAALIAPLKGHPDVSVRRWLYKLVGLLRSQPWGAWLAAQLSGGESDPENMTWAYGAMTAVAGTISSRKALERGGHYPLSPALIIAKDYFRSAPPIPIAALHEALDTDDQLTHQWLSLRRGKDPDAAPREVLRDLTTSERPLVVEYAVWAAHRDPLGGLLDIAISPADFLDQPENVRRWYIRLLVKDPANILPYYEIIEAAKQDRAHGVREGLALGLAEIALPEYLVDLVATWWEEETDSIVLFALRGLLAANRRYPRLRNSLDGRPTLAVSSSDTQSTSTSLYTLEKPAKIVVPRRRVLRIQPTMNPLPVIVSDSQQDVFVLGIDTVGFSLKSDRQQFTIFRDLLDALQHQDSIARQDPTNLTVLPTGDGVFVCLRGAENRLTPLKVALSMRGEFAELRAYGLRFGVNAGPATWIELRDGPPQVISHAVNWAARVMSEAGDSQIFLSEQYFQTYVHPARDLIAEATFQEIEGRTTKHGETIRIWEALSA